VDFRTFLKFRIPGIKINNKTKVHNLNVWTLGRLSSRSKIREYIKKSFNKYEKILKLDTYDLVHIHFSILAEPFAKAFPDIKYIITEHSSHWFNDSISDDLLRESTFAFERSIGRISVSKTLSNKMQARLAYDFVIIPNMVNCENVKIEKRSESTRLQAIIVGRLDDNKGIHEVVDLINNDDFLSKHICLTVVGDGKFKKKIIKIISGNKNISYFKSIENSKLIKLYQSMDLLISYSKFETFGLTIAEALVSGLRVIYTKGSGIDDFIIDQYSKSIVRTKPSLKTAISRVINERKKSDFLMSKYEISSLYSPYFCDKNVSKEIIEYYYSCLRTYLVQKKNRI